MGRATAVKTEYSSGELRRLAKQSKNIAPALDTGLSQPY